MLLKHIEICSQHYTYWKNSESSFSKVRKGERVPLSLLSINITLTVLYRGIGRESKQKSYRTEEIEVFLVVNNEKTKIHAVAMLKHV